jgi:hypothetical protein
VIIFIATIVGVVIVYYHYLALSYIEDSFKKCLHRKCGVPTFVHAVFTLNEKHPWLTQESNPDPLAQKSDVLTTVLSGLLLCILKINFIGSYFVNLEKRSLHPSLTKTFEYFN